MGQIEYLATCEYKHLQEQLTAFALGEISSAELKHSTAPFGIYEQKNGSFMVRIRITGGLLFSKDMNAISKILSIHNSIGFIHLTTRQDIQLHDVPIEHVYPIVNDAVNCGLTFRGGGGNTYRNIAVSPESGLVESSVFDVHPYAQAIQNFVFEYPDAYTLPRKLKIGISCSDEDSALATVQDLGFIAHIRDEQRGFKVYIAGGMGRKSSPAIKIFEFLPEHDLMKAVAAIIDFFNNHGNRENRNKARLRFLREKLGDEAFLQLYMSYFAKTSVEKFPFVAPVEQVTPLIVTTEDSHPSEAFELWLKRSSASSIIREDIISIELFVPNGNFTPKQFSNLTNFLVSNGCEQIRLSSNLNLLIPFVRKDSLSGLFHFLSTNIPDLRGESFIGMLKTCVGSTVCKIGILNTPHYAEKAAEALDKYFADKPTMQASMYKGIINAISFSGCPNSCGAHRVTKLGFQGSRKRLNDTMTDIFTVFRDAIVTADKTTLGKPDDDFIIANDIESFISNWLKS